MTDSAVSNGYRPMEWQYGSGGAEWTFGLEDWTLEALGGDGSLVKSLRQVGVTVSDVDTSISTLDDTVVPTAGWVRDKTAQSKSIYIADPVAELIPLWFADQAITILEVTIARNGTGTVIANLGYNANIGAFGTQIDTSGISSSANTATTITSFNSSGAVPAGNFLNLDIVSIGSATGISVTVKYEIA